MNYFHTIYSKIKEPYHLLYDIHDVTLGSLSIFSAGGIS